MFIPFQFFKKLSLIVTSKFNKKQTNSFQNTRQFEKYKYKEDIYKETDHVLHQDSVIANATKYLKITYLKSPGGSHIDNNNPTYCYNFDTKQASTVK
jgi:hypothetical protein